MSDNAGAPRDFDQTGSDRVTPGDVDRPLDDVIRLHERGGFQGKTLILGCATGETALYLASQGIEVVGIDSCPSLVEQARAGGTKRGLKVVFEVGDPLKLGKFKKAFQTILDVGLFHLLSDADRLKYVQSLQQASRDDGTLHVLCYSDQEPGGERPRRIGERELIETFNLNGWLVEEIAEARMESRSHPEGARAWLATFSRYVS